MKVVCTILAALGFSVGVLAQKENRLVHLGNEHYKKGQYQKAINEYNKAVGTNSQNSTAAFNLGNALYRTKKIEDAQQAFEAAAQHTNDAGLQSQAFYNQGVAYTRDKKLGESINAFKKSLRINPNDQQARENLQKAINEQKKQQQQQNQKQNKQQNQQQQQNKQQSNNNSKLNQNQAERMLNALRQEEKNIQKNLQKQKFRAAGSQGKDW